MKKQLERFHKNLAIRKTIIYSTEWEQCLHFLTTQTLCFLFMHCFWVALNFGLIIQSLMLPFIISKQGVKTLQRWSCPKIQISFLFSFNSNSVRFCKLFKAWMPDFSLRRVIETSRAVRFRNWQISVKIASLTTPIISERRSNCLASCVLDTIWTASSSSV